MPVTFVFNVNLLTPRTTVAVEIRKDRNAIQGGGRTLRTKLDTSCAQNRPF